MGGGIRYAGVSVKGGGAEGGVSVQGQFLVPGGSIAAVGHDHEGIRIIAGEASLVLESAEGLADGHPHQGGRGELEVRTYDPRTNPAKVTIKEEEVLKWLNNGAQPSDTVKNLLSKEGIIKKFADSKSGK